MSDLLLVWTGALTTDPLCPGGVNFSKENLEKLKSTLIQGHSTKIQNINSGKICQRPGLQEARTSQLFQGELGETKIYSESKTFVKILPNIWALWFWDWPMTMMKISCLTMVDSSEVESLGGYICRCSAIIISTMLIQAPNNCDDDEHLLFVRRQL